MMIDLQQGEAVLIEAATTALEGLAFAFLFPDSENSSESGPADAGAAVRFVGPWSGTFRVRIGGGVLPGLAATMLGQDEPPAEPLQRDALAELANVICGTALPALAGAREVFRLEAPTVCEDFGDEFRVDPSQSAVRTRLAVEDGWAELLLSIDSPAAVLS